MFDVDVDEDVNKSTCLTRDSTAWTELKLSKKKIFRLVTSKFTRKPLRPLLPAMSKEKRKAPDDWIEATILDDSKLRGAYLASFSGVLPSEKTTFREYKRKRNDDHRAKDVILQGETERIEFEGKTKGNEDGDNCQYYMCLFLANERYAIGILNREKGTVKLLPTPMIQMQRSIKALKSKAAKAAPPTPARVNFGQMLVNFRPKHSG
jgi:hypothetical protein